MPCFIEFVTLKKERVALNINRILYVTDSKKGCIIFDLDGMEYTVSEDFVTFVDRLNSKCVQKV